MEQGIHLVCFYGPESTGKSTMSIHLADQLKTTYVPEVAREIITTNVFTADDIATVGKAQKERIESELKKANRFLLVDSDFITTAIYSQHYIGEVPSVIFELEKEVQFDRYFLFDVDVPWVDDGIRDLGHERKEMFAIFKGELDGRGIDYVLVKGDWQQREKIIRAELDRMTNSHR